MKNSSHERSQQHKKFTQMEDNLLMRLVRQYGACNWGMIANFMTGRTSRQCRERYKYYLSMPVKNGEWTEAEDELLVKKYEEIGPHWVEMSSYFNSRTDINLKNRFNRIQRILKKANTESENSSIPSSPSAQNESDAEQNQLAHPRMILSLPLPVSALK